MEITLTLTEALVYLAFSIGFLWGEAFSGFDGEITHGDNGFDAWPRWQRFLVTGFLNANHHFQLGLMAIIYANIYLIHRPLWMLFLKWIGWGLIVSDWKDYKNVLKRFGVGVASGAEPIPLVD